MRTYTRAALEDANRLWDEGRFSPEWRDIRHRAAMGGLIFPPEGDAHDSWEDDSPSQRAILIRAIRETPKLLDKCVVGAHSWYVVVERLLRTVNEWGDEIDAKERHAKWVRDEENATPREAAMSLKSIMNRIGNS